MITMIMMPIINMIMVMIMILNMRVIVVVLIMVIMLTPCEVTSLCSSLLSPASVGD